MKMKELLTWLYGKSARNAHIRDMASKTIEILREKESLNHEELAKILGIEFTKYKKPKRTFYFVVNPLIKVQLIKKKRVFLDDNKKKYNTIYYLDPAAFNGYMTRILQEFHSNLASE